MIEILIVVGLVLLVTVVATVGLLSRRGGQRPPSVTRTAPPPAAGLTTAARTPAPSTTAPATDAPEPLTEVQEGPAAEVSDQPVLHRDLAPALDTPDPTAGRLTRLRSRLARSQTTMGRGLFALLSRDTVDDGTWEEVEETLLTSDMGLASTNDLVGRLKTRVRVEGIKSTNELRTILREELLVSIGDGDRSLRTLPHEGRPAVLLVVGVNGTGKTTTCGKLARVLVADGRSVVLGAADTFRAAAADQLQTWGSRVGAETVRGPEGGDPASIAFDAVKRAIELKADTVLIDTAGRLHTKTGLMDELGKVKRVVEKHGPVDETLLVLDATTGQNGLVQARMFTELVEVTGIVLTKMDGTAKGGIVIAVQRELGIPVKLIGLGEGPDDLAPFEPEAFADALLGDEAAL